MSFSLVNPKARCVLLTFRCEASHLVAPNASPMWHPVAVADDDPVLTAIDDRREEHEAAKAVVKETLELLHRAIADAVAADRPVNVVAERAGIHRNHVGRIAREHDVPDARRHNRPPIRTPNRPAAE
jgi:hypothetical protein